MTGGPATPPPVNVPIRPPGTKDGTPPPPPPPTKCADCGKSFTGYAQTRWDVHVGGGVYKTVCTACFGKAAVRCFALEGSSPPERWRWVSGSVWMPC